MAIITTENTKYATLLTRYSSLGELTDTLLAYHAKGNGRDYSGGWGGKALPAACAEALAGVPEDQTRTARKLLERINANVEDRPRMVRTRAVAGQRVNMGAYIAGLPKNMVRRSMVASEIAPIKLVMEITVAGGVTDEALQQRGAALAALAYALSKTRPVELHVCWALGGHGKHNTCMGIVKIPTGPLSLSQALAVMATNSFARNMSFSEVKSHGYDYGGWGLSKYMTGYATGCKTRVDAYKDILGLKPHDIFLPGGSFHTQDTMLRDPVAWVNTYLDGQRTAA
jgi:hypothetical protein